MKKKDIESGKHYIAKVSERETVVRVDEIRIGGSVYGNRVTLFDVTNLRTGRTTTFRSALKFRREATAEEIRLKTTGTYNLHRARIIERQQQTAESPAEEDHETNNKNTLKLLIHQRLTTYTKLDSSPYWKEKRADKELLDDFIDFLKISHLLEEPNQEQ